MLTRDGTLWRIETCVLTADECEAVAGDILETVGLCEATDHGLTVKAIERCVVVVGCRWLTGCQAVGLAADLLAAGASARAYREPKRGPFGGVAHKRRRVA